MFPNQEFWHFPPDRWHSHSGSRTHRTTPLVILGSVLGFRLIILISQPDLSPHGNGVGFDCEACSSRLSFILGSILGFGLGLRKPENWWMSILGSVLGFSLIILKPKSMFFDMFWRMQKTVEGEETSISAVLHHWFYPRFQPKLPKRPSSQVSCLMISYAQETAWNKNANHPWFHPEGRMNKNLRMIPEVSS